MKSIILFSVVLICGAYATQEDYSSRIIGGVEVNTGQYPSVVSLQKVNGAARTWFCGGTILDEYHILTSAQCVYKDAPYPSDLWIQYGVTELIYPMNLIQVRSIVTHPDFKDKGIYEADVAILELYQPIPFSETVRNVQLPNANAPTIVGAIGEAVGWGNTKKEGSPSQKLLRANEIVYDDLVCTNLIKTYAGYHICANGGIFGICKGDFGGPLYNNGAQIGISSWLHEGCGSIYPDAFVRVASYVDWIKANSNYS